MDPHILYIYHPPHEPTADQVINKTIIKSAMELAGHLPSFLDLKADQFWPYEAEFARFGKAFSKIFIVGTGGSTLGGRLLNDLGRLKRDYARYRHEKRECEGVSLEFIENIDPLTFATMQANWEPTQGYIFISKSGTTPEVLSQSALIIQFLIAKIGPEYVKDYVRVITELRLTPLTTLAQAYNIPVWPHRIDVGGRFSVLSMTGWAPGFLSGIDIQKLMKGAQDTLETFLAAPSLFSATQSAAHFLFHFQKNAYFHPLVMVYADQLISLGKWFLQLWAESLGKKEFALTPFSALGTVDQHSQLQLYLEGANDKLFTFIAPDWSAFKPNLRIEGLAGMCPALIGLDLKELIAEEFQATIQALMEKGRPVQTIILPHFYTAPEETMGALIIHFFIETLIVARQLGINAFDQPAVERIKTLTKEACQKRPRGGSFPPPPL